MRHPVRPRSSTRTFAILTVLMLVGACGQRDTLSSQTTTGASTASVLSGAPSALQPMLDCVADNGDGSTTAFVGYRNTAQRSTVALSSSGRRDVQNATYLANAAKRDAQRSARHPTRRILTERVAVETGTRSFAFGLVGKSNEDTFWAFGNQTLTASPRDPQQRCRFPDADQRIADNAVGWPLVTNRYVFWRTDARTQRILRGYDLQTRRAFVVATFAPNEGPLYLTSDRAETTLAWVESGTYEGAAYQHLARIRAYDLTTSTSSTLVEARAPATSFQNSIAIDNGVLFYRDITAEHSGLFARTLATGAERLIAANGSDPVVGDDGLLYTTQQQQPQSVAPLVQLHLYRFSDTSERIVTASTGLGMQYAMSGDDVVWAFTTAPDTRVHRYSIGSGRDAILASNGTYVVLAGKTAAWTTTTLSTEHTPTYHTVTSFNLATGTPTTLVTASTFALETVGVSATFGPVVFLRHPQTRQGLIYVTNNEARAGRVSDGLGIAAPKNGAAGDANIPDAGSAALKNADPSSPTIAETATSNPPSASLSSTNATPAVLPNQVNIINDKFYVNGNLWQPHGVQFLLPSLGINGKTLRDDEYNDPLKGAERSSIWLPKAKDELLAKSLRVFIDLPGEGNNAGGNRVSPGTIYRFAVAANIYGFKLGLVLHNSGNFTMTPEKRAWIQNLMRCIAGLGTDITGAVMPNCSSTDYTATIFYLSADNELNKHDGAYDCPSGTRDCYDYDGYVIAARQWVQDFSDLVRQTGLQLDRQFWITVGLSTEVLNKNGVQDTATYVINHFFEMKAGKPPLTNAVDFISPHNYGGAGTGMYTPIQQAGYRRPVLLEEYGYPTDPYKANVDGRKRYTENPPICLLNPLLLTAPTAQFPNGEPVCQAPYFVAQNIAAIEQHFAGGMYWMLADIQEKNSEGCDDAASDLYTGAFAIGGRSCGGTLYNGFGELKSTGRLVCRHHGGTAAMCNIFLKTFLPLAKRDNDSPAASAAQRSSNQSADAYPGPATPTPNPYPAPSTPTPTPTGGSYPATSILDTFNRADGALGNAWTGDVGGYTIRSNHVETLGGGLIFYDQLFGANQEVYVTLPTLNSNAAEIDLILKAQGSGQCDLVEVWYEPVTHTVQVVTCQNDVWTQQGSTLPLTLQPGDRFGARALADGTVTIYQNATLVGSVQIDNTWSFRANGGRAGLWTIDASGTVLDDFGAGTLP